MTGRLTIDQVRWADAELERVAIDYDAVVIEFVEPGASTARAARCEGYIGYELVGFWDEAVIEKAELVAEHPLRDRCLARLNARYPRGLPDTGQEARNAREYSVLVIHLRDGAQLIVAAHRFELG